MKVLNLEIHTCSDCPYIFQGGERGEEVDCGKTMNSLLKEPTTQKGNMILFDSIPDWCPLENKNERP